MGYLECGTEKNGELCGWGWQWDTGAVDCKESRVNGEAVHPLSRP